ncbi:MAG: nucleotidyltransferase domain-containing protein [Candidatus Woesearchaeota archaeon]|nr:nucleotidyltransferase domain-containing protein [Candidatus Woesearchaeota archaeon]
MITAILNNKSAWKLLALMSYSPGAGYTRKEILDLLRWNNLSLDRALRKLEFFKIIKKENRSIKFDFGSEDAKILLEIIENDKKRLNHPPFELFLALGEFLRLAEGKRIDKMFLFGSYAKKTASAGSDIDIAVFSQEKVDLIEAQDKMMQEQGKKMQVHYFKAGEKGKLVDEILKHGVRLV